MGLRTCLLRVPARAHESCRGRCCSKSARENRCVAALDATGLHRQAVSHPKVTSILIEACPVGVQVRRPRRGIRWHGVHLQWLVF